MENLNLDYHGQCMQLCFKLVRINFDKKLDLVA